jgi:hypothetical protein
LGVLKDGTESTEGGIKSAVRQTFALRKRVEGNDARVARGTGTAVEFVSSFFVALGKHVTIAIRFQTYLASRAKRNTNADVENAVERRAKVDEL